MCMTKFLYEITNGLGNFYVVAEDVNSAAALLIEELDKSKYGFSEDRIITNIKIIASEDYYYNGERRFYVEPYKSLLIQKSNEQ